MTGRDNSWPDSFRVGLADLRKAPLSEEARWAQCIELTDRVARELTVADIANPRDALRGETAEFAAFEARLEAVWGRGLDLADLAVSKAFEVGQEINELRPRAAAVGLAATFEALIRLHGAAVLTAREVLTLLRAGYASGAFARWRTLHEVMVVSLVLGDGDEELSRRYLAHDEVEAYRGQKNYERAWEIMGHAPPDWQPSERTQREAELKANTASSS